MAHECPNCGSICYCNGDIDDLLLNCDDDVNKCICCLENEDDEMDDIYDYEEEEDQ
jgi:hypothetical protein